MPGIWTAQTLVAVLLYLSVKPCSCLQGPTVRRSRGPDLGSFKPVLKHEVTSLPGYNEGALPSRHTTGHIPVHGGEHLMFYWLVESEHHASDDPVVLWLSGGPGCSSLDAFIYEHGPFNFEAADPTGAAADQDTIRLTRNPWSWSKAATMIYVDSPIGSGFSYSTESTEIESDDQLTSGDLLEFITKLIVEVHPQLLSRDFYIAGESYAGVFVPMLVSRLIDYNGRVPREERIKLKGYALGNAATDDMYDGNGQPEFAYNMGLIDPTTYMRLLDVCGGTKYFWNATQGGPCDKEVRAAYDRFYWLNPYDILADCYTPHDARDSTAASNTEPVAGRKTSEGKGAHTMRAATNLPRVPAQMRRAGGRALGQTLDTSRLRNMQKPSKSVQGQPVDNGEREEHGGAVPLWSAALQASAAAGASALQWPLSGVRGGVKRALSWNKMVGHSVPCADRRVALQWLNLPEVRTALHAPPTDRLDWQPCSDVLHYDFVPISMIPLHEQALDAGLRVLVYSGDHDMIVPFTGTRAWVYSLGLTVQDEYEPWMIRGQVAGFRVRFKAGLVYATVKGAGHMVPQTSPEKALHLLRRFLENSL